jgi:hypothetical protein
MYFSLLRFVPDPARGEFINVGAIAGDSDSGDWDLRILSNLKRARAIDSEGRLPAAMAFLAELEERLPTDDGDADTGDEITLDGLRELTARMNNIIQITPPGRIVASDAAEALDVVCADLLLDPATSTSHRYRNRSTAVGATSRAYRDAAVPETRVKRAVEVDSGGFHGTFDFVVHNGRAVQLAKCYSFELPDQESLLHEIMAWAWLAHEVRGKGGTVTPRDGVEIAVPRDLSIACVYVPPRDGGSSEAFHQARSVFDEIEIDHAPATSAVNVANIAAHALTAVA